MKHHVKSFFLYALTASLTPQILLAEAIELPHFPIMSNIDYLDNLDGIFPPPEAPDMEFLEDARTSSPINSVLLGEREITIESNTLIEIQDWANTGMIYHKGEAGESNSWLCYTNSHATPPERIWFSAGVLGGPDNTIDTFHAIKGDDTMKPAESCPELPAEWHPVSLSNTLWLGSHVEKLEGLVGKPSAVKGDWRFYFYNEKLLIRNVDFYLSATLGIRVSGSNIVEIYESQITTN